MKTWMIIVLILVFVFVIVPLIYFGIIAKNITKVVNNGEKAFVLEPKYSNLVNLTPNNNSNYNPKYNGGEIVESNLNNNYWSSILNPQI